MVIYFNMFFIYPIQNNYIAKNFKFSISLFDKNIKSLQNANKIYLNDLTKYLYTDKIKKFSRLLLCNYYLIITST